MATEGSSQRPRNAGHLIWTEAMDRCMLETFKEHLSQGLKPPVGWKSLTFTAIINNMLTEQRVEITRENIKSRRKTWKKFKLHMDELLRLSGFGWDSTEKVLTGSDDVWADVLLTRPYLRPYKGKDLSLFMEIAEIEGDEYATGERATTATQTTEDIYAEEATQNDPLIDETMQIHNSPQNENGGFAPNTPEAPPMSSSQPPQDGPRRKRSRSMIGGMRDEISGMRMEIGRVASAMEARNEDYWTSCSAAVKELSSLTNDQKRQAMELFVGSVDKRKMFLNLDEEQRFTWIMLNINF